MEMAIHQRGLDVATRARFEAFKKACDREREAGREVRGRKWSAKHGWHAGDVGELDPTLDNAELQRRIAAEIAACQE